MADEKPAAEASADVAGSNDKPTLDSLLEDWQSEDAPPPKPEKPSPEVLELLERDNKRDLQHSVAPIMKGDLKIDDDVALGYLYARAGGNPDLKEAFDNRYQNPTKWNEILENVATEFQEKMGTTKEEVSDDNAVAAAAAMARETKPADNSFESVDWDSLNDTEFETRKREMFRALGKGELR